jgi:hypothetical protein
MLADFTFGPDKTKRLFIVMECESGCALTRLGYITGEIFTMKSKNVGTTKICLYKYIET